MSECTCIYGLTEDGRQDLLEQQPYCPTHDADGYVLREELARAGYRHKSGAGSGTSDWDNLTPDNQDLWRSWAECELWP